VLKRDEATAFAPCHVTAFFVPNIRPEEPPRTGSWGAGLCLGTGVIANVEAEPADNPTINVERVGQDGDARVTREALRQMLGDANLSVDCTVREGAPVGQGLGVSGASALAAAFALARCLGVGRSRAMEAAHRAEIRNQTGLGDVVSSFLGGVVLRSAPGLPPYGSQRRLPAKGDVMIAEVGEVLDTDDILRDEDPMQHVSEIGQHCIEQVADNPSLETLFEAGNYFTRETGLVDDDTLQAVEACRREGGHAMAAMLGNTVVAYGDNETLADVLDTYATSQLVPIDQGGLRLMDRDQLEDAFGPAP